MHTPSLVTRVVVAGGAVVLTLAIALDVLLYVTLRTSLMQNVDRSLDNAAALVAAEVAHERLEEVPARVAPFGIWVTLTGGDGSVRSASADMPDQRQLARRTVVVGDGLKAEVAVSRTEADRSLSKLLRLELVATPLVFALALLLLKAIAEIAVRPLDRIAKAARRTAEGQRGERLRPHPTRTRLGQMATAYDEMLDALEAALTEAQEAKRYSEQLLERDRNILATAHEAFIGMDESGVIVDWNAAAERTFGWRPDEAIGRRVADTVVPVDLRTAHIDGLRRFLSTGETSILGRRVEMIGLCSDGSRIPIEMTVWATRNDGETTFNAFVRDITESKRAQEAISRLAAIVESSDDAIVSRGLDGRILTWNAGAEHMYGYGASEAVGQHISLIVPDDRRAHVEAALQNVLSGKPVQRVETVRRCKNGTLIDVALTISPLFDGAGTIIGACSVGRDVTEQHWLAAQLDHTLAALEEALQEARASEAATRRFLDDAAHQLRTPITTIRASAELLLRGIDGEDGDRLLSTLATEAAMAGRLMSGLLQLARLNQGTELTRLPCDVVALCRKEAERLELVSPELEVRVTAEGDRAGLPLVDQHALSEILSNLLDNARRHARSRIEICIALIGEEVEIRVDDDGPGVAPEDAERIFERFVTLDRRGGSGLGLPIARGLARAHGGDLFYKDDAFVVRLPASGAAKSAISTQELPSHLQ